ncbi:hypothetical protein [Amphritea sp. HPY]|uniref:hypothetical protein n=1 Tax=Amphritea sp. HPY TaxID=3421652 RepID=UPI003D7E2118
MKNIPTTVLIAVTSAESFDIQQRLFDAGWKWHLGETHVMYTEQPYLLLDGPTKRIKWVDRTMPGVPVLAYNDIIGELQSVDELVDENSSLCEQIDRLTQNKVRLLEELEALDNKIAKKQNFYQLNAESIRRRLPEGIAKFAPYMPDTF